MSTGISDHIVKMCCGSHDKRARSVSAGSPGTERVRNLRNEGTDIVRAAPELTAPELDEVSVPRRVTVDGNDSEEADVEVNKRSN